MVDPKQPKRLRELIRRQLYRVRVETPEMLAGKADHAVLEKARQVDLDPRSVILRIKRGETFYFSLALCSVRYGIRGTPDAVLCKPQISDMYEYSPGGTKQARVLRLLVIDDKTHLEGRYFKQIWAYGMMLSDPNCMYTGPVDSESEDVERRRFYDDVGGLYDYAEISVTLNPYHGRGGEVLDKPLPPKVFSKAGIYENNGLVFAVLKAKKQILEAYHEPQRLAASAQMRFSMRDPSKLLPPVGWKKDPGS